MTLLQVLRPYFPAKTTPRSGHQRRLKTSIAHPQLLVLATFSSASILIADQGDIDNQSSPFCLPKACRKFHRAPSSYFMLSLKNVETHQVPSAFFVLVSERMSRNHHAPSAFSLPLHRRHAPRATSHCEPSVLLFRRCPKVSLYISNLLDPGSSRMATRWLLCLCGSLDLGAREYGWGSRQLRIVSQ